MGFNPSDLQLTPAERAEADSLEKIINSFLKDSYVEGRKEYTYHSKITSKRVMNEVLRRYKVGEGGWKKVVIDFNSFFFTDH